LAVTVHWIEKDNSTGHLKLRAALIAFHRLRGSHNGPRLARIAVQILDQIEITAKVCGLYFIVVIDANHGLGGSLSVVTARLGSASAQLRPACQNRTSQAIFTAQLMARAVACTIFGRLAAPMCRVRVDAR
jgi:hypothetical protein